MHNVQHQYLGLHGHAILLSLPPVLLVWAIVAFTVSVTAYTVDSLIQPHHLRSASAWITLSVLVVLLIAVLAALYIFSIIWKFQTSSSTVARWISSWTGTARYDIIFHPYFARTPNHAFAGIVACPHRPRIACFAVGAAFYHISNISPQEKPRYLPHHRTYSCTHIASTDISWTYPMFAKMNEVDILV